MVFMWYQRVGKILIFNFFILNLDKQLKNHENIGFFSFNRARRAFKQFLEKNPIIGNSIVYGTLCVGAETSQQIVSKKILAQKSEPLDKDAIFRYIVYGTGIGGPLIAVWYTFLDRKIPGTALKAVASKMLFDQLLFTSNLLVIFYISMSIMERKSDIFAECKEKFVTSYIANCGFWLPAQFVNFTFVPALYRVTYIGTCSFLWINILCWLKRQ